METFTQEYYEAEPVFTKINNHAYIESVGFDNACFVIYLKSGIHDRDLKESILSNRGIEDVVAEYGSDEDQVTLESWLTPEDRHRLYMCFNADGKVRFSHHILDREGKARSKA